MQHITLPTTMAVIIASFNKQSTRASKDRPMLQGHKSSIEVSSSKEMT